MGSAGAQAVPGVRRAQAPCPAAVRALRGPASPRRCRCRRGPRRVTAQPRGRAGGSLLLHPPPRLPTFWEGVALPPTPPAGSVSLPRGPGVPSERGGRAAGAGRSSQGSGVRQPGWGGPPKQQSPPRPRAGEGGERREEPLHRRCALLNEPFT